VFLLVVVFLVRLGHALATVSAFVVLSGAAHVVESEFGDFNLLVTNGARLGFSLHFIFY
jgi:hypothetical protein